MIGRRVSVLLFAGLALLSRDGLAVDKAACITSHGESQSLKQAGKLRAARGELVTCSNDACPGVLRKECMKWLEEIATALPTVVVEARASGVDRSDVKVSVDGEVVAAKLDGNPIAVDPGAHTFRYEIAGFDAVEQKITVRAGEQHRRLAVTFGKEPVVAPPPSASSAEVPAPPRSAAPAPVPVLAYVLGGVGVVGLGAFAFFGLSASSKRSDLDDRHCKPACPQGDVDAVKQDYLFANLALGVGVVSLGVATYLFLARGTIDGQARSAVGPVNKRTDDFLIEPSRGGAWLGYRTRF